MRAIATPIARACLLLTFASAVAVVARADDEDPPTRAARLSYIQGSVSFQPAGTQDWVAPPINRPFTTGDQLWVDSNSRAELQLGDSVLRAGANTSLSILNLGDQVTQVQLSTGSLVLHVRHLYDQATYEIDTPNLAFTALQPGTYRIDVDPNGGTTTIDVRRGQGEATGGGTGYSLYAGEDDVFSGTDQLVETARYASPPPDEFDAWGDGRDDRWEHSASARYVAPDVVGYEDLDDQGTWTSTPGYGYVWFPGQVAPGWAPYQSGHWAYVPPWGYTWVDDQPWGFAPFHYGRWIWSGGAWGWVPAPPPAAGVVYVRPVYAPALVAWVGAGAAVAWFALGPREVYVPSYPVSRTYVNAINVTNTTVNTTVVNNVYNTTIVNKTVVNNITYVNRTVPGAIVATTQQAFTSAAPVARNRAPIDAHALAAAPVRALTPAVVPTRQAVLGSGHAANAHPPASVIARPVVARREPPPPPPPLEQRLKAIQSNGGRPLSAVQVRQIQPAAAAANAVHVRVAPPVKTLVTPRPDQGAVHASPPTGQPPRPATAGRPTETPATSPASRPTPPARTPETPAARAESSRAATHVAEMPPPPRPSAPGEANTVLERQHLQEQQRLQAQQLAERQRVQQQQEAEHQALARQQAQNAQRQQQQAELERQHQQQTQALEQQQARERQQLEERQQQQHTEQQVRPATPKRNAPPPPKRPPQENPQRP